MSSKVSKASKPSGAIDVLDVAILGSDYYCLKCHARHDFINHGSYFLCTGCGNKQTYKCSKQNLNFRLNICFGDNGKACGRCGSRQMMSDVTAGKHNKFCMGCKNTYNTCKGL
jgi:DNA-directed RNA polymerase subunit RPC12/RpoP